MDFMVQLPSSLPTSSLAFLFFVTKITTALADRSYHHVTFHGCFIPADKSSTWRRTVFQLSRPFVRRPHRGRVPGHFDLFRVSHLRCCSGTYGFRERPLDDSGWISSRSDCFERFLEIHILSDRLSTLHICGPCSKPNDWEHLYLRSRLSLSVCHQPCRPMPDRWE